ncbi:hypothetical protein [Actinomadura sp. WMMA1423]|uniref:hypothetical protein n=1 Tax=Actinomadura sp. WMMA1423 TaxID=2591108 RepID=UPI00114776A9|nr:hypothetical protein [Actinomadura sp. WMMA1423]
MTVHGRYTGVLADSPVFDDPFNALPGIDRDTTFARTNIPIWAASADLTATGTGVAIGTRIWLARGDLVTNLAFTSGATAGATYTHWWHALYSPDGELLAQTADQVDAAWGADTTKRLALAGGPVKIKSAGWYIAATAAAAATVQTLAGAAARASTATVHTGSKAAGFTFGSGLGATAPATTGTQTAVAKIPLVVVS